MITVNMTKAVEIKKDMIRAERDPKLAALDVEFMRAVEAGDTAKQAEISTKKQALRDATPSTGDQQWRSVRLDQTL